ncbi:hypothetical protein [Anaeromyxobacter oryzae]|uniref:Uncharacterized protein n=1 Tax=Anaeromyxobacter oryzae TaxID=2918170 RepID=A0ABM7WPT0_9BACT|nr:hypothetical protein [Anaeromyxobacter oryzae]BDG01468.1 hypothetical protein AMOR_04640 [Anaeromyxobacter oryzae]
MQQSKTIPQESPSYGQSLAAIIAILGVLVITVPVIGILMIPFAVLATVTRALRDAVAEAGLLRNRWTGQGPRVPGRSSRSVATI